MERGRRALPPLDQTSAGRIAPDALSGCTRVEGGAAAVRECLTKQNAKCAPYQAKCANALLASAMRCTLSRLVTAAPSRL